MSRLQELIRSLCPDGVVYKPLGEVCSITIGEFVKKDKQTENGKYPVYNGGRENTGFYEDYNNVGNKVIISARGVNAGFVNRVYTNYWAGNSCYSLSPLNTKRLYWIFLYYVLKAREKEFMNSQQRGSIPALSKKQIDQIRIPLPPLEVQAEIVRILDAFTSYAAELQAELQARKEQYTYYRNRLLSFDKPTKDVTWKRLGEIGDICMCKRIMKNQTNSIGGIPFYKIGTFGKKADAYISPELYNEYKNKYSFPQKGEVLISASGTVGRTVIYDGEDAYFQDSNIVWIQNDETEVLNKYLFYYYQIIEWNVEGGTIQRLYNTNLAKTIIAVPSLSEQQRIVSILDRFEALVNDLTEGLPAEIAAVQEQYEYYRNQLLSFPRKEDENA